MGRQNIIAEDATKNQSTFYNKKLNNVEIELKNKFNKIKKMDERDYYTSDRSLSVSMTSEKSSKIDVDTSKIENSLFKTTKKTTKKSEKEEKIIKMKKYSSIMEILVSFLIVSSALVSLVENQEYYNHNYEKRVLSVLLINNFRENPNISSYSAVKIFENINLAYILNKNDTNLTNDEILSNLTYNYTIEFNFDNETKSYDEIYVPLEIPDKCNLLRMYLLVVSLLSSKFIRFYYF